MTLQTNGTHIVEPVEYFLRNIICAERLSLYQRVIDVIKNNQKFSMVESLNSIVNRDADESAGELMDYIHGTMIRFLTEIALEYDVVVAGADLNFLIELVETLNVLDVYDAHQTIVDTIESSDGDPRYTLYKLLCVVQDFDEVEYFDHVMMCSMSLLERTRDVHQSEIDHQDDEPLEPVEVDLTLLRKVVRENNDLVINRLLSDGKINNIMTVDQLTTIALPEFEDFDARDPKQTAREMIALYLASGLKDDQLIAAIKEQLPKLIADDFMISQVNIVLNNIYVEMTT